MYGKNNPRLGIVLGLDWGVRLRTLEATKALKMSKEYEIVMLGKNESFILCVNAGHSCKTSTSFYQKFHLLDLSIVTESQYPFIKMHITL